MLFSPQFTVIYLNSTQLTVIFLNFYLNLPQFNLNNRNSPQFTAIQAIETKDIVIKKMVYLYLCNYAPKEPDMAVLCINSLRRDW